jgi:hypothetical protein
MIEIIVLIFGTLVALSPLFLLIIWAGKHEENLEKIEEILETMNKKKEK